jgi:multidrug efflux pump subunit AcrA (membrane-fusion protein)
MRILIKSLIFAFIIVTGGMAMATETTPADQVTQLKQEVDLLTQQLALLKAQAALDSAKQTQDALSTKALLDALKDQTASQSALGVAQAQLPFAELQGIKAATAGITLPAGKEGTVKVSAGTAGTALLRSKRPMLELLDGVADDFVKFCPTGAAILTEAQLGQASSALFTLKRIENETSILDNATNKANPRDDRRIAAIIPAAIAGAYTLGFALDTINSLIKLLRTNRQLDVFSADTEALQILGYLLESKGKGFIANPGILGNNAIIGADNLLGKLRDLATKLQNANDVMTKIKKYSDDIAKAPANDPIRTQVEMPTEADTSLLKAEIDNTISLLDGLHPSKKPDAFWAQVTGQVIAANIKGKMLLFIDAKAQTIQITESRWYTSDRILATGEVQVAYRLLKADSSLERSGIILKASKSDNARIDELNDLNWERPQSSNLTQQKIK